MLTRRGLFRRAAQSAIAAPIAVLVARPSDVLAVDGDPEAEPEVPCLGTGGDITIIAGTATGSGLAMTMDWNEHHRLGWELFREGLDHQFAAARERRERGR